MTKIQFIIGLVLVVMIVAGCTPLTPTTGEEHPHEEGQTTDDGHHDEMMEEHPHEEGQTTDDGHHDE